jgi:hypothetical protein
MGKQYQQKIDNLIKQVRKFCNSIPVRTEYIGYAGNIKNAIFLTQLIYWSERATRLDGGIYKTNKEWQSELGLTKREFENARTKLEELGVLSVQPRRANGHFTNHYYLDFGALETSFKAYLGVEIESDVLDAEFVEESKTPQAQTPTRSLAQVEVSSRTRAESKPKTPMPVDFRPSEAALQELKEQGFHPSLLEQYAKECRHYYTVKNNHHRYPDWDDVYKRWCSKNPKTDANTERSDDFRRLANSSVFERELGTSKLAMLARQIQKKNNSNANY